MKSTVGELKELAQKYSLQGKRALAAETYQKIFQEEPANPRWPQKAGEEYRTIGQKEKAIAAFQVAAKLYAQQGFTLKAIALCKLILDLDKANQSVQQMLAGFSAGTAPAAAPPRGTSAAEARLSPSLPPELPPPVLYDLPEMPELPDAVELTLAPEPEPLPAHSPQAHDAPAPIVDLPHSGADSAAFSIPPGGTLEAIDLSRALPPVGSPPGREGAGFEIFIDEPETDEPAAGHLAAPVVSPKDEILTRLPPVPIFSSLDRSALRALVERVEVRTYAPGARIITQGEAGHSLFVLVDGEVSVLREGPPRVPLTHLKEGAFFGEIALITKAPRTATVEAVRECQVLEIPREVFNELVRSHPEMVKVILRHLRERLVSGLVKTHPLFAPFAGSERGPLVRRFSLLEAAKDSVLAQEGMHANGLYIILCGEAESRHGAETLSRLGSGDLFGVESLLTGQPSQVSVRTLTKCWILKMRDDMFREVILTFPPVLATLSDMIADQSRQTETMAGGGAFVQLGIPLF